MTDDPSPQRSVLTEFYRRGIEQLLEGIARFRVCVLCSEEDPSHCHRRLLITRTLVEQGVVVHHVRGTGAIESESELRAKADPRQLSLLDRSQLGDPTRR